MIDILQEEIRRLWELKRPGNPTRSKFSAKLTRDYQGQEFLMCGSLATQLAKNLKDKEIDAIIWQVRSIGIANLEKLSLRSENEIVNIVLDSDSLFTHALVEVFDDSTPKKIFTADPTNGAVYSASIRELRHSFKEPLTYLLDNAYLNMLLPSGAYLSYYSTPFFFKSIYQQEHKLSLDWNIIPIVSSPND